MSDPRARLRLGLVTMMGLALCAFPSRYAVAEAVKPEPIKTPSPSPSPSPGVGKGVGKTASVPAEAKSGSPAPAVAPDERASSDGTAKPTTVSEQPSVSSSDVTKPGAKSETNSSSRRRKRAADEAANDKVGQGPSPASPPPLTMGGLRDEMRRESAPMAIDPDAAPRSKVEQMLSEITKARQALHEDTVRLEGMLAQDGSEPASGGTASGGSASGAAGPAGRPAAKNPLDILAKALRGIKPDQAAPIVARLDKRLAATVLQRMPPVDAGKIMGAMKPDTAAELATQIAMRVMPNEAKR